MPSPALATVSPVLSGGFGSSKSSPTLSPLGPLPQQALAAAVPSAALPSPASAEEASATTVAVKLMDAPEAPSSEEYAPGDSAAAFAVDVDKPGTADWRDEELTRRLLEMQVLASELQSVEEGAVS